VKKEIDEWINVLSGMFSWGGEGCQCFVGGYEGGEWRFKIL
jgi:hypothetical protein